MPEPIPVPIKMQTISRKPLPAPKFNSPIVATSTSFPVNTGSLNSSSNGVLKSKFLHSRLTALIKIPFFLSVWPAKPKPIDSISSFLMFVFLRSSKIVSFVISKIWLLPRIFLVLFLTSSITSPVLRLTSPAKIFVPPKSIPIE